MSIEIQIEKHYSSKYIHQFIVFITIIIIDIRHVTLLIFFTLILIVIFTLIDLTIELSKLIVNDTIFCQFSSKILTFFQIFKKIVQIDRRL